VGGTWLAWGTGEVFIGFWLGGLKVSDHWVDLGISGEIGTEGVN
jgi:hypothetical protein